MSTTEKGHCRHCSPRCKGGAAYGTDWVTWHMTPDALVRWHPKRGCPMCAAFTHTCPTGKATVADQ